MKLEDFITVDDLLLASDIELDALYSYFCLGEECDYDINSFNFIDKDKNRIPKYCNSFGRNYIIEKITRVLRKDDISKRHS